MRIAIFLCGLLLGFMSLRADHHGYSVTLPLKHKPDFSHYDYVNPDAPKGGKLKLTTIATFDNYNPFIIAGDSVPGIAPLGGSFLLASLTSSNPDEQTAHYGYVAKSFEIAKDKKSVTFVLRPEAKFHDGSQITAEDVAHTFDLIKNHGSPIYRNVFREVTGAKALSKDRVQFTFSTSKIREPLDAVMLLPILSKKDMTVERFKKPMSKPPLGSGPYKVADVSMGRKITYQRVKDWWGEKLGVNRGRFNFDEVTYLQFRDHDVELKSFQAGDTDFRSENIAKKWANAYSFEAVKKGDVVRVEQLDKNVGGFQALYWNTQRPQFQDVRVREAISQVLDFQWLNKNVFYSQYQRVESLFPRAPFSQVTAKPEDLEKTYDKYLGKGKWNKKLLIPIRFPNYKTPKAFRDRLRTSAKLLREAGYVHKKGKLVHGKTGQSLDFEILMFSADGKHIYMKFIEDLETLGIEAQLRVVDTAQYIRRIEDKNYDAVSVAFPGTFSPGLEQREFWSSAAADRPGGRNLSRLKDPQIDQLIEALLNADEYEEIQKVAAALDRFVMHQYPVMPQWTSAIERLAYWKTKITPPPRFPEYGIDIMSFYATEENR